MYQKHVNLHDRLSIKNSMCLEFLSEFVLIVLFCED